jgi:hypothetical protein
LREHMQIVKQSDFCGPLLKKILSGLDTIILAMDINAFSE